jgi:hypothetical protein
LARRREREEQQAKDAQIVESGKLARQRVCQEQRDKDEQLLESYRLAKLRDKEQRKLRVRQDEQRRRITRARDDSMTEVLLQHEASIRTYNVENLLSFNARPAYKITIDAERRTTEITLVSKLSNVTKLPSKHKGPSRNHSQKDVSLPSMVFFPLS